MELKIRLARQADFDSVYNLIKQLWPNMKSDYKTLNEIYLKGIDSVMQRLIVGELNNQVIGFCSLTVNNNLWQAGNLGHVDELVIDKDYRGKGFGKKMIESITQIARDLKCKRIELDSGFHRKDAHRFYESIGYENRAYLFSRKLI
ncbi:MAG: GNAT family N-acetyltransferase [Bacteroidetes bacterium]|nr:GNAT family N-acetyltransferase [Bacteroidota bacterium]